MAGPDGDKAEMRRDGDAVSSLHLYFSREASGVRDYTLRELSSTFPWIYVTFIPAGFETSSR